MIVSIITGLLFILTLFYYIFMVSYAGFGTAFATVWLLMAFLLLAISIVSLIMHKKNIKLPVKLRIIIMTVLAAFLIFFFIIEGKIIKKMNNTGEAGLDYVIVLGAQVRGTRITKSLAKRLDEAVIYLNENENTKAVLSGGQGNGEDISEAEAMYGYLIDKGIAAERLLLEDKSRNTYQNVENSMAIIKKDTAKDNPSVGFITNNFHVYRAEQIFEKMGYKVKGIAAKADNKLLLNYMFREFFAVVKYKVTGNI